MMSGLGVVWPSIVIGLGATAFMDVIAWFKTRFWNMPSLNYALVGRWIVAMSKGQFVHDTILQSQPQRYERTVGWVFHYGIGVFFVALMLASLGVEWLEAPNLWNPLLTGILSVCAPFFIMQPAFGFGLAASKTPSPWVARQRSLFAHLTFGMGIYVMGIAWAQLS